MAGGRDIYKRAAERIEMNHGTQTGITYPARAEVVMMLVIMALLILNLATTIYAATYEPVCVPAIMEEK